MLEKSTEVLVDAELIGTGLEPGAPDSRPLTPEPSRPSFLSNPELVLLFFGGKGGTGKTTSAAASALWLARSQPDRKVLIVSTDPAHSLGDSLGQPLCSEIAEVPGVPNLSAIELDSEALLEDFRKKNAKRLQQMAAATYQSYQADLRNFFTFRLPGMEDLMIFGWIAKCLRGRVHEMDRPYDIVVVDTAPTGHTLRLLSMPTRFARWIEMFHTAYAKFRGQSALISSLGMFRMPGVKRGHPGLHKFLDIMMKDIRWVKELIADTRRCEFVMVTIPEEMGIAETERLAAALKRQGVTSHGVVVNRVQSDPGCAFCRSRAKSQAKYIKSIQQRFSDYQVVKVPLFAGQIRGLAGLGRYGQQLAGQGDTKAEGGRRKGAVVGSHKSQITDHKSFLPAEPKQFRIFGGKGGVGKTSTAVSSALWMAKAWPEKRVLVVSADPAHSLGDSLDLTVGDQLVTVPGYPNLTALELDAAALYQQFRDQYVAIVNEAFDTWLGKESGVMTRKQVQFDRELVLEYVDSYPPGVEETLFLERLAEFVDADRFDLYVLDPAPTGHLLKLLAFPELIKQWLRVTYRAIVKYQQKYAVANLASLGERTLQSTTALRHMRKALTDPQRAELTAVTIPETMSVVELGRLLEATRQIGHATGNVVCNMLVPSSGCDFCKAKREEQLGHLEQIIRVADSQGATVTQVEQFPSEVRGLAALERMGAALYGDHPPIQTRKHEDGVTRQSPRVHPPPRAGQRSGILPAASRRDEAESILKSVPLANPWAGYEAWRGIFDHTSDQESEIL